MTLMETQFLSINTLSFEFIILYHLIYYSYFIIYLIPIKYQNKTECNNNKIKIINIIGIGKNERKILK